MFGDADDISSDEEAANKVTEKVQGSDDEAGVRDGRRSRSPTGSDRDDAERLPEEVGRSVIFQFRIGFNVFFCAGG